jgi:hypothetical protein
LFPAEEGAGRADLGGGDHALRVGGDRLQRQSSYTLGIFRL